MGVKLHKKSVIINNLSIFSILSLCFLHIIESMGRGASALDWFAFFHMVKTNILVSACFFLTFITIRHANKISKVMIPIFCFVILWKTFVVFFEGFDKLILILNLTYLTVSYYFYSFWIVELEEPIYVPGYSIEDVGRKSPFEFHVKLFFESGKEGWGYLTQVGETSCFIAVEDSLRKEQGRVKIIVDYKDTIFEQYGEVITSYGGGFGIKFLDDTERAKGIHTWNDFYIVVCHRGLLPQYFEGLT